MLNTINLKLAADGTLTVNTSTASALGVSYENDATTVNIDISAVSGIASYTHYIEVLTPNAERFFVNATYSSPNVTAKLPNSCLVKDGYALVQLRSESGSTIVKSKCLKFYVEKSVNAYDEGVYTDPWVAQTDARIDALEGKVALLIAEQLNLHTWRDVQILIQSGLAEDYLPVGTEITLHKESSLVVGAIGNSLDTQGITAVSINDHEKFLDRVGTSETAEYEFYFDGVMWQFDALSGNPVDLAEFGLSVTGTPNEGDEFMIHETASEIPMQILAYGERAADGTVTKATSTIVPSNPNVRRWAVFCSKNCIKNQIFGNGWDAPSAFYVHTAMPAGTYYFHGYKMGTASGGTTYDGIYEFTLTQPVPAGGTIDIPIGTWWDDSQPSIGNTVKTYNASGTVIESGVSLSLVGSSSGTDIGYLSYEYQSDQASYPAHSAYTYSNTIRRMFIGSNDYAVSLIRQYINADAKANQWYVRRDPFQAPVPGDANVDGFLYGADVDFKNALLASKENYYETDFDYYTNGIDSPNSPIVHALIHNSMGYDGRKMTVNGDKVFLLSNTEVNANGYNDSSSGNSVLKFYEGAGNADRIKLLNGAARYWWLRAPDPWYSFAAAYVITDGSLNSGSVRYAYGCVPACIIG